MLYKDLTTEQQDKLNLVFCRYGVDIPKEATHIDDEWFVNTDGNCILKIKEGIQYFLAQNRWINSEDFQVESYKYFPIPEDFCRKTGEILSQEPSGDVSNQTDTNTQSPSENVSNSLTEAFKTIQELCVGKGISLSFDSQCNVQILTAYGDYVLDTNREDLQDVITKMADVNQIVKGMV